VNNQPCNVDDSQEMRWKIIKDTIDVAAKDLRTKDIGIKKKHWFNDKCQRAVTKHNEDRKKMLESITPETAEGYNFRKAIVNKTIRREKRWT